MSFILTSQDAIAHQLGHESIATTQLYAQLADEGYEQEYERFFGDGTGKQLVIPRRPTVEPDTDVAYR